MRGVFSELLNDNKQNMEEQIPFVFQNDNDVPPPSRTEVDRAIQRLKNNKSAGSVLITADLLKAAWATFNGVFQRLLSNIWISEKMPEEWNVSILCLVHKKDDRSDCKNYRRISLFSIAYKILASIMNERLKPHVIRIVGPYQCGVMPGKSTSDQIFALRQILEKTNEYNIDTHHSFIDLRQAYDTPTRDELFRAMNQFGTL